MGKQLFCADSSNNTRQKLYQASVFTGAGLAGFYAAYLSYWLFMDVFNEPIAWTIGQIAVLIG